MAENTVEEIAREVDVTTTRAEQALEMEDGDASAARERLTQAPSAIKARFAVPEERVYGLFYLLIQLSPPSLLEVKGLVGNSPGIGSVQLGTSLDELSSALERLDQRETTMTALTQQMMEALHQEFSPPGSPWINRIQEGDEMALEDSIAELINGFIENDQIMVTVELERGILPTEDEPEETPDRDGSSPTTQSRVQLLCDVEVSPVRGTEVQKLGIGDRIYVTIKNKSEQNTPLIEVIDQLKDESVGMIPVPIVDQHRTESGKIEYRVQFGQSVYGKVLVSEDMNILTPRSSNASAPGGESSYSYLPWIIVGVGVLIVGLTLLWAVIFS